MDDSRVLSKDAIAKKTQELLQGNMEIANKVVDNLNECIDSSKCIH